MPESSVKDLTVRLAFEHGDTKSQIASIKNEIKLLDSGFQAAAMQAGGFSTSLDQTRARGEMLKKQISLQEEAVRKYGIAMQDVQKRLDESIQSHQRQGQELEAARQKHAALKTEIDSLKAAMAAEKAANGDNTESYIEMSLRLDELNKEYGDTEKEITRLSRAYAQSDQAIARNDKALQSLTAAQNLAKAAEGQLRQELTETERRVRSGADAWESSAKALRQYAETAKNAGTWQTKLGKQLTKVSAGIVTAGVYAGKAAIDWESDFAGVRKTVSGTEQQLQDLERALLDMEVPTDYSELAAIAANAGQLGIATENVAEFTRTMADLAETTDLTADAAASSFAQYANITKMPQENIGRLGSVTVELGNNLATTESKIVDFATAISAAGSQAGMTDQQIFGLAGGLASLGLEAQAGGTAFSKAIIEMKVAAETGSDDLKDFAKVAGMSAEEFKQAFAADAAGTFIKFVQGLSSGSESAVVMLDKMGITETRLRDTLLRASNASELLTKSVTMANAAWKENSALANEAAVRYQTTASRMQMLQKSAQKTAMSFGEMLLPFLEKGMDAIDDLIEKFNGLTEAQKQSVLQWAAYAVAAGPAFTALGKANTLMSSGITKIAEFSAAMAKGAGGISSLLGAISGLIGPAGWAVLVAGAGLVAYKLYDVASGAAAAREAMQAMNATAKEWLEIQAETIYDTGTSDPLGRFGMTKEQFKDAKASGESWMSQLVGVWTDGKAETDEIVQQFVDSWKSGSDDVRKAIEARGGLMGDLGVMDDKAKAKMDADMKQLDSYDEEIETLLKKRQNGFLTESDQKRLNEVIQLRAELQIEYGGEAQTAYDQVVEGMQAEIDRMHALGQDVDATVYGDTLNALAEGRKAYNDSLTESYNAQHAQIMAIEDEATRTAALAALNQQYNEQRLAGEEAYNAAVKEAGVEAWQAGGFEEQITQLNKLATALNEGDLTKISGLTDDLDEGKLTSMIALMEQLRSSGLSDEELLDLGINVDDIYSVIEAIRDMSGEIEGAEGLHDIFTNALPDEITRVLVGLDMTQAAEDWQAFSDGAKLTPTLDMGEEPPTLDAVAAFVGYNPPEGQDVTLDALAAFVGYTPPSGGVTLAGLVEFTGYKVDSTIKPEVKLNVRLNNLDARTVAAWKSVNGSKLSVNPVRVGLEFDADWMKDIETLAQEGKIALYDKDGLTIPVTPEAVHQLSKNDLVLGMDEDGVYHIQVALDVNSPEALELSEENVNTSHDQAPWFLQFLSGDLSFDTKEKVQSVKDAADEVVALQEKINGLKQSGQVVDEFGTPITTLESDLVQLGTALDRSLGQLSEMDLDAMAQRAAVLMAALESDDLDPETAAQYKNELQGILDVIDIANTDQWGTMGINVAEGIAKGMNSYGWSGDASTLAASLTDAINGALGAHSPATRLIPTGSDVAEGIAHGMTAFSFAAAAAGVSSGITGAFAGLPAQGRMIGTQFGQGLYNGLQSRMSSAVALARQTAAQITSAFQNAWQIHSPSRVAENLTDMFGRGLEKGMQGWPTVSEQLLQNDLDRLYSGARQARDTLPTNNTYNNDNSLQLTVERMEVRDETDIDNLAAEINSISARKARSRGLRR